jgi:seryl-tRNA synthetase
MSPPAASLEFSARRKPAPVDFGDRLRRHLYVSLGADGVTGRTALHETVAEALGGLISRRRPPGAEVLRFPPVMSRRHLEKAGYLDSFPHLLGCVSCLTGGENHIRAATARRAQGLEWTGALAAADLVLTPAACYPVYPLAADRGPVPAGGLVFDVSCDCFRREPSQDLDRLQSFRMREFVRIGSPTDVRAFRDAWLEFAVEIAGQLGLPNRIERANDPFFGRGGAMMAQSQHDQSLKFELRIPVWSSAESTACMSFNDHQDHFGEVWGLRDAAGAILHTGCVAFGLDRLVLALFSTHGLETAHWPAPTLRVLGL